MMETPRRVAGLAAILLGPALLSGCSTFSQDGGMDRVEALAGKQLDVLPRAMKNDRDVALATDEANRLLSRPLDADDAVKLAILNNRGLQSSLAGLGIAEADLVQAGRLKNPGLTFSRQEGGGVQQIERQFLFDVMGLLTLSQRTEIERRRFAATQTRVAGEVLRLAQATRQAYFSAVAAQQAVKYMEDVQTAAQAGAELAGRMAEAGNFSRLRQQREQLFLAEVDTDLERYRQSSAQQRERLTRLLGLHGEQRHYSLPDRLPDLPGALRPEGEVAKQALSSRLDVRMARQELEGLASSLGLTRATRFVNVLETSYLNGGSTGEAHRQGYEIELNLPLFDWGDARVAKAEALYTQAMHRTAEIAVNAESEVRETYAGYRAAHAVARRYRDEIVPLRKRIAEENMLRYNGMLIGVWELLADARGQMGSVNASIQALKDFWVAESVLQMSLNGSGDSAQQAAASSAAADEAVNGH